MINKVVSTSIEQKIKIEIEMSTNLHETSPKFHPTAPPAPSIDFVCPIENDKQGG